MNSSRRAPTKADYERLLAFRDGLRRFLTWSEDEAKRAGITAAQHQLLLAIRGHGPSPSVGDIAHHLQLRHHSVVELIDRAAEGGLVERVADPKDQRVVRVRLTARGKRTLDRLAASHLEELSRIVPALNALWRDLPSH